MFKPDLFLSNFAKHKDFAKVSKFHVEILKPPGLNISANFSELRFQCEAAELPGYNLNTVDARIYGVAAPAAATASFNDVTLTFICAGDLWEKRLFDSWLDLIIPKNNYHLNYKDEYVSKVNVTQFYETGEPSMIVSLWNAFPISVSPLSLNWGDDSIHKLSVVFKYDYWTSNPVNPEKPAEASIPTDPAGSALGPGSSSFIPGDGKQTSGIRPPLGASGTGYTEGVSPRGTIPGGFSGQPGADGRYGPTI